jgi:hypothetical protein
MKINDGKKTMRTRTMRPMRISLCLALLILAQGAVLGAELTFQELAQRLPASTNAVVAINVKKALASPYGKREHWGSNAPDAWAKQPVMIPPGASRLIMAADVKTSTIGSNWEMSLIEMAKMPTVQELASAEGGHVDRIWDKDGAYSPINAYFVPIEPTILASISPAERSLIARWVRTPVKPEGNVTSEYIKKVVAGLGENTDMVMAIDLEGAFGLPNIRRFLDQHEIKEIPDQRLDATAEVLGSMKGIKLEVTVGEGITGRASVQFERDATLLRPCAKPVMIAVLKRVGMRIDDVQDWKFTVAGKELSMQGNLSSGGLRELLGMVQSPIPAATVAVPTTSGAAQPAADPAQASQRYYKAVAACISNLREGTSVTATATSMRNVAKRIDQMPILGVDPELVQWGGMCSAKLKQVAGNLSVGQVQINARVAGVKDPEYISYNYDQYGNPISTTSNVTIENANKERRQLASQQKAETYQQVLTILNEIAATTPPIRQAMVQKYNVEF